MQNLIQIKTELIGTQKVNSVNARELWKAIGSKQDFSTWIKGRISKYKFIEGEDYISFHKKMERDIGATSRVEYIITLDMAKELAMVETTKKSPN